MGESETVATHTHTHSHTHIGKHTKDLNLCRAVRDVTLLLSGVVGQENKLGVLISAVLQLLFVGLFSPAGVETQIVNAALPRLLLD